MTISISIRNRDKVTAPKKITPLRCSGSAEYLFSPLPLTRETGFRVTQISKKTKKKLLSPRQLTLPEAQILPITPFKISCLILLRSRVLGRFAEASEKALAFFWFGTLRFIRRRSASIRGASQLDGHPASWSLFAQE